MIYRVTVHYDEERSINPVQTHKFSSWTDALDWVDAISINPRLMKVEIEKDPSE